MILASRAVFVCAQTLFARNGKFFAALYQCDIHEIIYTLQPHPEIKYFDKGSYCLKLPLF